MEKLPRIIRFLNITEGDTCPHCGARGRYIHRFILEGGVQAGAMSGCVQLFPISPIARVELRLAAKARKYHAKGWELPSWDRNIQNILGRYYGGEIPQDMALHLIKCQDSEAKAWRQRKGAR